MKVSLEELRCWQLHSQHLTAKTDLLEAAARLCGFQAQYPANARLRAKQPQKDGGLAKSWTLRGTLHHIPLTDLPLYVSRDGDWWDTAYFRWLSGHGKLLPRRRMERFAQTVLDGLSDGPMSREDLKTLCRQAGMTQQEEPQVFDGWGGVIRLLCEADCGTVEGVAPCHPAGDLFPLSAEDSCTVQDQAAKLWPGKPLLVENQ